jgi:hypothetical protein
MRIHVRFLRETDAIQEALQKDGWQLEWERDDFLTAQHPLVQDEAAARNRLQELGLLTARSVGIEFVRLRVYRSVNGC